MFWTSVRLAQMLDEPPEGSSFEFGPHRPVDLAHASLLKAAQAIARCATDAALAPSCRDRREQRLQKPVEPCRPFLRAVFVGDQILPDLDQRGGEAPHRRVAVDGVARKRTIIGLVVADDEPWLGPEAVEERTREALVAIPEDPCMPGRVPGRARKA